MDNSIVVFVPCQQTKQQPNRKGQTTHAASNKNSTRTTITNNNTSNPTITNNDSMKIVEIALMQNKY